MRAIPWLLLLTLCLAACPAGDDDDSSAADDDDATPLGEPPTLDLVEVCEVPFAEVDCGQQNVFAFAIEFRLTMSDPDGDLVLPRYCIAIDGNPFSCASVEQTIPSGGRLDVRFSCGRWGRGETSTWEAYIEDREGNESERVTGAWDVPVQPGDADCD
jgi:hypothetical protein